MKRSEPMSESYYYILLCLAKGANHGYGIMQMTDKLSGGDVTIGSGTMYGATGNMMKANAADHLATGENAVITACRKAQIIVGPIGIAMADAMLGEISPAMANAVASSTAYRVLIPMNLCDTYVAGTAKGSAAILADAMDHIRQLTERKTNE